MNIILSIYEHLRSQGVYEVDWVDRMGWRIFAVFVFILILV